MKAQELQLKARDQAIKAQEAAAKVSPEMQWEYDRQMAEEQRQFDASEKAKDRELDLAKALISSKKELGEEEFHEADEALNAAAELLTPGVNY